MKKSINHVTSYTDLIKNTSEYLILQHAFLVILGSFLAENKWAAMIGQLALTTGIAA